MRGTNKIDIQTALEMYYGTIEIGTAEIKQLFGISSTTATLRKKQVLEVMADRNIKPWRSGFINTKLAFEVWGIDPKELELRAAKLKEIKKFFKEES